MSAKGSRNQFYLSRLEEHLKQQRYSSGPTERYTAVARRFLSYLKKRNIAVEAARPSHACLYLRNELRHYRKRHGRAPESMSDWRSSHIPGIHMLLRLVHGQWPPIPIPSTRREIFHRDICEEYAKWMGDIRGLALATISECCAEARRFLIWLGKRGSQRTLCNATVADVDNYVMHRAKSHRRTTSTSIATRLRSFLRFLFTTGGITRDLSTAVVGPTLYAFESIPSSLRSDDVKAVLETTLKDHSPKGLRDYAILALLSNYGLRAGEIAFLRLDDVDWRNEVLRIHHSKTGAHSELPLLPAVGNALLDYLQRARPKTDVREVFIRVRAPYRPFKDGGSLYELIRRRLTAAGVHPPGKRGPHIFRHARAVSLLRAAVPVKEIGDVLGHRSSASTAVYLKLATEDLRAIALEIPAEVRL